MPDYDNLILWVEEYFNKTKRTSSVNGIKYSYYHSLRGYFKHATILTDIKEKEFGLSDYKIWERLLTRIKSSKNPIESGGLFFRYKDYSDICSESSFYSTKKKLLKLELLIETPFNFYYIINPRYIVKAYNPSSDD